MSKACSKKPYKSVCTSRVVVPPDPLSPKPSTSVMQTLEITHKDPDAPKPADEGDIQMEHSRLVVQPKYRNSNKKITCKNLGQYSCDLLLWNI
jgi:hypothetical protein